MLKHTKRTMFIPGHDCGTPDGVKPSKADPSPGGPFGVLGSMKG